MPIKYFAYGSNMAPEVMDALCPKCRFLGPARLDDHRLAFTRRSVRTGTGVADATPAAGVSMWGALYDVDENDLVQIDRKEGSGSAYKRDPVEVFLANGSSEHAITYTVIDKESTDVAPAPNYLYGLIKAAHRRDLPAGYIDGLESLPSLLLGPMT